MLTDKDGDRITMEILKTVDGRVYYYMQYLSIEWMDEPLDAVGRTIGEALTRLYRRKYELRRWKGNKAK